MIESENNETILNNNKDENKDNNENGDGDGDENKDNNENGDGDENKDNNENENGNKNKDNNNNEDNVTPSLKGEAKGNTNLNKIQLLLDIDMDMSIEIGRTKMKIDDVLNLNKGSIVELNYVNGEYVDIMINNKQVAKGELVAVDDNFGVRIINIIEKDERLNLRN